MMGCFRTLLESPLVVIRVVSGENIWCKSPYRTDRRGVCIGVSGRRPPSQVFIHSPAATQFGPFLQSEGRDSESACTAASYLLTYPSNFQVKSTWIPKPFVTPSKERRAEVLCNFAYSNANRMIDGAGRPTYSGNSIITPPDPPQWCSSAVRVPLNRIRTCVALCAGEFTGKSKVTLSGEEPPVEE